MKRCALAAALTGLLVAPALAQQTASPAAPTPKAKDPNEVICEKQEVLGSRLAVRRVCMTRAEWAEHKRLQRQTIDKTQVGACQPGTGRGC